jgi:phosphopantothenoylcysteine synthetase/decarboxylase
LKQPQNILLGVSGSINVANIFPYISALQSELSCRLHIMMTPAAQTFLPASTLQHSIDGEVFTNLQSKGNYKMPHVELTHWADAYVVLPASANTLAKIAHGFAEDIVSATLLCADGPTILFPSMYIGMWQKNSVQRNVKLLQEDGFHIYQPQGTEQQDKSNLNYYLGGSLPAPIEAARYVKRILSSKDE